MLIYIILMATVLFFGYFFQANESNKRKLIFLLLFGAVFIVIAGLRSYTVGIDTKQFVTAFNRMIYMPYQSLSKERYEYGFTLLCKLLSYLSHDPQILIFTSSAIIFIPLFYYIYKNSKDVVLSVYLLVSLCILASNMNVMRQGLAGAIILLAIEWGLKKKKYFLYILLVLLACQFHRVAIFGLVFLIMLLLKRVKTSYVALALLLAPVAFLTSPFVFRWAANLGGYEKYIGGKFAQANYFAAVIGAALYLVYLSLHTYAYLTREEPSLTKSKYVIEKFKVIIDFESYSVEDEHEKLSWVILIFQFLVSIMGIRVTIMRRASELFCANIVTILPLTIDKLKTERQRATVRGCVIGISFCYWLIISIMRPHWQGAVPYRFFI